MRAVLIVVLYLILATSSYKTYDGYKMIKVTIGSEKDFLMILDLESKNLLTIFAESRSGHVDVLIEPQHAAQCKEFFKSKGLSYEVMADDVGVEVAKEKRRLLRKSSVATGEFSYDTYHRYDVISDRLAALAAKHQTVAEIVDLGTSYEGRTIKAIRMTANISSDESDDKPMVWLDGGSHAREWVSPATMMYIIDSILGEQETDKSDKMGELLAKFQIVVAPCINPDGYEFSYEEDRFWRKNRQPSGCKNNKLNWYGGCFSKLCYGVDNNRNWSVDWGRTGVSTDPCSEIFPGRAPFDQPNTKAVKDYLEPLKDKLKLFVTYHSYSEYFLTPLGYTEDLPADHEHHTKVGEAVVRAIAARHGVHYVPMRAAEMYPCSGDSADWAYEGLGVGDSYTIELRPDWDSWKVGFELPEDQIRPTAEENVDGLLALIENIKYSRENNNGTED
ncbi:hypothetical protein ACHWQZ_G002698 [Mnemiopsis leidyi]